jgi:hypothetical protein
MRMNRLENGKTIVRGHFISVREIVVGSEWMGSGGSIVTVDAVAGEWVTYSSTTQPSHKKLAFAFQCRYNLIIKE